ncbi:unnamed protein product [Parajaminaea phylloscopi]
MSKRSSTGPGALNQASLRATGKSVSFLDTCFVIPRDYSQAIDCERKRRHPSRRRSIKESNDHVLESVLYDRLRQKQAQGGADTWSPAAPMCIYPATTQVDVRLAALRGRQLRGKRAWSLMDVYDLLLEGSQATEPGTSKVECITGESSPGHDPRRRGQLKLDVNDHTERSGAGWASFGSPVFAQPSILEGESSYTNTNDEGSEVLMAAPRPAYRPLSLGTPDSDDEETPEELPMPRRMLLQSPVLRLASPRPVLPTSRRLSGPHAPGLHRRPSFTDHGPPISAYDRASELLGPPLEPESVSTNSPQGPLSRLRGVRSAPELVCASQVVTLSARPSPRIEEAPTPAIPSIAVEGRSGAARRPSEGKRRTSWFRKPSQKTLAEPAEPATPGDTVDEGPDVKVARVPLHSECSCKQCSGRILAGLAPGYVPHWSRSARAKWLADRKHAEMTAAQEGTNAPTSLGARAFTLSGGHPSLVLRNVEVQAYGGKHSPQPSKAFHKEPHSPVRPTRTEAAAALLEHTTKQQQQHADPSGHLDVDAEAEADLQSILSGGGDANGRATPALQVDEVDKRYGDTQRPAGMGAAATHLEAVVDALEDCGRLRPSPSPALSSHDHSLRVEHNGTPVGVSDEESIPMDAELKTTVEQALDARALRRRSDQMIRRGGARAMMAQLDEADRREQLASSQRMSRRDSSSTTCEGPMEAPTSVSGPLAPPARPMGAYTPPPLAQPFQNPSSRPQSPALTAPTGPRRTSSPFLERIRSVLPSTSYGQAGEGTTSPTSAKPVSPYGRAPSISRTDTDWQPGPHSMRSPSPLASGSSLRSQPQPSRTPSPFVPANASIREETLATDTRTAGVAKRHGARDAGQTLGEGFRNEQRRDGRALQSTLKKPVGLRAYQEHASAPRPHLEPANAAGSEGPNGQAPGSGSGSGRTQPRGASSRLPIPDASAKASAGTREAPSDASSRPGGLRRSKTLPTGTDRGASSKDRKAAEAKGSSAAAAGPAGTSPPPPQSSAAPSSAAASPSSAGEEAQRRLKMRSLQRRLSTPLKGLFRH